MEEAPAAEVIVSPNIWTQPDVYEIENQGVDPDGAIWAAGAGTGEHPGTGVDYAVNLWHYTKAGVGADA